MVDIRLLIFLVLCCCGQNCFAQNESVAAPATVAVNAQTEKPKTEVKKAESKPAADKSNKDPKAQVNPAAEITKPPVKAISPERQAIVDEFIKSHYPELGPLLGSLKKHQSEVYHGSLNSLDREIRYLQNLQKRSNERYDRELKLWIVRSKIRVSTAHLALKDGKRKEKTLKKLRDLVTDEHGLKLEKLIGEFRSIEERRKKMTEQIASHKESRDKIIKDRLADLAEEASRISQKKRKKTSRPSNKDQTKKSEPMKPVKKSEPEKK